MPGPRKDVALVRFALSKLDLKTNSTPSLSDARAGRQLAREMKQGLEAA